MQNFATMELLDAIKENTATRKRMAFYSHFKADTAIAGVTTLGSPTLTAALSVTKKLWGTIAAVGSLSAHLIGAHFDIHGRIVAAANLVGNLTGTEIMMDGLSSGQTSLTGSLTVTPA